MVSRCKCTELYSDYPPLADEIWCYLITPTEHDATTQEVLKILCHAFLHYFLNLVEHTIILVLTLSVGLNQFCSEQEGFWQTRSSFV